MQRNILFNKWTDKINFLIKNINFSAAFLPRYKYGSEGSWFLILSGILLSITKYTQKLIGIWNSLIAVNLFITLQPWWYAISLNERGKLVISVLMVVVSTRWINVTRSTNSMAVGWRLFGNELIARNKGLVSFFYYYY